MSSELILLRRFLVAIWQGRANYKLFIERLEDLLPALSEHDITVSEAEEQILLSMHELETA